MGGGQTKQPLTEKTLNEGEINNLRFGLCEMQGWRENMVYYYLIKEDASIIEKDEKSNTMMFGVLDGHGGKQVSKFVAKFFFFILKSLKSFQNENFDQALIETYMRMDELLKNEKVNNILRNNEIDTLSDNNVIDVNLIIEEESNDSFDKSRKSSESKSIKSVSPKKESKFDNYNVTFNNNLEKNSEDLTKEIKSNFNSPIILKKDPDLEPFSLNKINEEKNNIKNTISDPKSKNEVRIETLVAHNMGTTANIIFIKNNIFYIANVGDSRAVLYKNGIAIRLNEEHKPSLLSEQSRINKSGFKIISNRIDGKLNLTRAVGKKFPNFR